jgi:hypothetical protein
MTGLHNLLTSTLLKMYGKFSKPMFRSFMNLGQQRKWNKQLSLLGYCSQSKHWRIWLNQFQEE